MNDVTSSAAEAAGLVVPTPTLWAWAAKLPVTRASSNSHRRELEKCFKYWR